jgi:hypothetical protein
MNNIITAEEIIKAYEATGITPIHSGFYGIIDTEGKGQTECGCALTALLLYKENKKISDLTSNYDVISYFERNLPEDFSARSFYNGYDRRDKHEELNYSQDFELGAKIRDEVEDHFASKKEFIHDWWNLTDQYYVIQEG